ncbi:MAG TPA: DUF5691 domain-containing protein [Streptosporangiaceae bacterium]|nr:DUF5691 domain-containing protein [Streptosporangiaceae bacterium]
MNSWHDLVAASLIGTERSVVPAVGIPGLPPAEDDPGDPAAVLLDRAALLTAARRAGRRPDRAEPLPVCAPDPRPTVSPAAARRLRRLISGEHPDLLTEWLAAAVARGLRLPPQLLPALMDRVLRGRPADPGLPRLLAEAGGPRARWLAGLNPDWEHAAEEPSTDDRTWRLGDTRQRRGYLASLLNRDPDAGRALITGGWDAAGAADRVMFLSVLADALGPADEPLLEAALDDGAEDVRRWAAYLLARLPGSALGQRMAERALRYVRVEQTVQGPRLNIGTPRRPDAELQRDGITAHPEPIRAPVESRNHVLLEVLARTPLSTWTDGLGLTPAEVVALPSGGWAPVMFAGWSRAAIAQGNRDWISALLGRALNGRPGTAAEIEALRQLARRADPALGAPGATPVSAGDPDAPPPIRDAVRVLRFRHDMLKELHNG